MATSVAVAPAIGVEGAPTSFQPLRSSENDAVRREVLVPQAAPDVGDTRDPTPDVLVVEDDEDEVWIIDRAIRRHGMEARFKFVRSGEDALEYLRAAVEHDAKPGPPRPKVVLLDLKLTGISGQDVLRQIREDARLRILPIVIVSSLRNERDVCECYRLGANSFVPKPVARDHPGEHVVEIARYWLELNRQVEAS